MAEEDPLFHAFGTVEFEENPREKEKRERELKRKHEVREIDVTGWSTSELSKITEEGHIEVRGDKAYFIVERSERKQGKSTYK